MNIINKILVPVDFSDSSISAINYVKGLTNGDSKVECILLHVSSSVEDNKAISTQLNDLKDKFFKPFGIECQTMIESGSLNQKIIEVKNKLKVDLIIMGTAGSAIDDAAATNTTELLENADCSVLIIPEGHHTFKMESIALALDENEFDKTHDLRIFHDVAKWFNAKVHLLTVDKNTEESSPDHLKQEETLEYYLQSLDYRYSFPKNSDIEAGINNYVAEKGIDALAILPRHHSSGKRSNGELTKVLAMHTKVPLLILVK